MKKNWTKLLSLALSIVMVLSLFAACGATNDHDDDDKEEKPVSIVGNWEATLDLADYYNQMLSAKGDAELSEALALDSLEFVICLNLNEDGTCEMHLDEAALEKSLEELKEKLINGMRTYLEAKLEGTGISLETALATQKTDLETLVNRNLNLDALSQSTRMQYSGTYKYEDGKLYIADEGEDLEDEEEYALCELKGNKMILIAESDTDPDDALISSILPITFIRK